MGEIKTLKDTDWSIFHSLPPTLSPPHMGSPTQAQYRHLQRSAVCESGITVPDHLLKWRILAFSFILWKILSYDIATIWMQPVWVQIYSIRLKQRFSIISVLSWVWSWGQGHCYLVTVLPLFFSFPTLSHPFLFCLSLGVLYLSQLHFNSLGAWRFLSLSASFPGFLFLIPHPSLPVFLGICFSSLKSSSFLYHSCLSYKFAQNHHRDNKY